MLVPRRGGTKKRSLDLSSLKTSLVEELGAEHRLESDGFSRKDDSVCTRNVRSMSEAQSSDEDRDHFGARGCGATKVRENRVKLRAPEVRCATIRGDRDVGMMKQRRASLETACVGPNVRSDGEGNARSPALPPPLDTPLASPVLFSFTNSFGNVFPSPASPCASSTDAGWSDSASMAASTRRSSGVSFATPAPSDEPTESFDDMSSCGGLYVTSPSYQTYRRQQDVVPLLSAQGESGDAPWSTASGSPSGTVGVFVPFTCDVTHVCGRHVAKPTILWRTWSNR
jgi:hypothetical protein